MFYENGQQVDVDALIERYKVPIPEKFGTLELHESQVRPDRANGGIKHTIEKQRSTTFRAQDPVTAKDIEISYSEATPIKKEGRLQFVPRKLSFQGHKKRLDMRKEKEKWVYLWLHPSCENSPFRNGKEPLWKVFDPEAIAAQQNKKDEVLTEALVEVYNMDYESLKHRAKGMGCQIQDMKESEVRQFMTSRAKADPAKFMVEFTSHSVEWKGTVRDAIDNGIFVQKMINGYNRWFWGESYHNGKEITPIEKSGDPFEILMNKMVEDLDFYRNELRRIAEHGKTEEILNKELKHEPAAVTKTKLREAIDVLHSKGYFDLKEHAVYWKKDNECLCVIKPGENHLDMLEAAANKTLKTGLKKMLLGTYNLVKNK